MATVPPVVTWTPLLGSESTSVAFNARIRDPIDFLKATPLCVLRKNATQLCPNEAWQNVTWQVEDLDTDNGHSTVSNTDRYTSQTAGYYLVNCTISWQGNATGYRHARFIRLSDSSLFGEHTIMMNGSTHQADVCTSAYLYLDVGDSVIVQGMQISGGNLNIQNDGLDSRFIVKWVSL